jgi:hypothetical protein
MPLSLIKALREAGCPAFDAAHRVQLGVLLKFFFETYGDEKERPPDGLATWREALNRSQTKRSDVQLALECDRLVSKDEVQRLIQKFSSICFGGIKRLKIEAPRDFEMRSKDYIALGME